MLALSGTRDVRERRGTARMSQETEHRHAMHERQLWIGLSTPCQHHISSCGTGTCIGSDAWYGAKYPYQIPSSRFTRQQSLNPRQTCESSPEINKHYLNVLRQQTFGIPRTGERYGYPYLLVTFVAVNIPVVRVLPPGGHGPRSDAADAPDGVTRSLAAAPARPRNCPAPRRHSGGGRKPDLRTRGPAPGLRGPAPRLPAPVRRTAAPPPGLQVTSHPPPSRQPLRPDRWHPDREGKGRRAPSPPGPPDWPPAPTKGRYPGRGSFAWARRPAPVEGATG